MSLIFRGGDWGRVPLWPWVSSWPSSCFSEAFVLNYAWFLVCLCLVFVCFTCIVSKYSMQVKAKTCCYQPERHSLQQWIFSPLFLEIVLCSLGWPWTHYLAKDDFESSSCPLIWIAHGTWCTSRSFSVSRYIYFQGLPQTHKCSTFLTGKARLVCFLEAHTLMPS